EECETDWERCECPPLGRDQCFDIDRPGFVACRRGEISVPDEVKAAQKTDNVAEPFQSPGDPNGQSTENNVNANMLTLTEKPWRNQQGHQIQNVLRDFIADRDAATTDIARDNIGADHQRHEQAEKTARG